MNLLLLAQNRHDEYLPLAKHYMSQDTSYYLSFRSIDGIANEAFYLALANHLKWYPLAKV